MGGLCRDERGPWKELTRQAVEVKVDFVSGISGRSGVPHKRVYVQERSGANSCAVRNAKGA